MDKMARNLKSGISLGESKDHKSQAPSVKAETTPTKTNNPSGNHVGLSPTRPNNLLIK
jgi:hypothetical protein